jgi:hypothetical protein
MKIKYKNIIIVFTILIMSTSSCTESIQYPNYELKFSSEVPDSLKNQMGKFIIDLVKSSNQHLSAGDFEDVEEVIEQAENTATRLYSRRIPTLHIKQNSSSITNIKYENELTSEELQIFNKLLNKN